MPGLFLRGGLLPFLLSERGWQTGMLDTSEKFFHLEAVCSWQFGCQLGIGDLAERVCRREGGTMFPGFCCGLSDCYQCNWAMDCRETGLNNPGGAEMSPWEEGRGSAGDHTRLCAVLLTFWLSATVMKLNEQNMPAEKEIEGKDDHYSRTKRKWTTEARWRRIQSINSPYTLSLRPLCALLCVISVKRKVTFRCLMGYFNNRDSQCRQRLPFVVQLCDFNQKM